MARLRIRELAEQQGISMGLLSRKANVTPGVIRKIWRNDRHDASFRTLEKIAQALGVPVSALIEDGNGDTPQQEQAAR